LSLELIVISTVHLGALLLLLHEHSIKVIRSRPYHPQSQGLDERRNRTVKDWQEMWKVDNSSDHWAKARPAVTLALNFTQHMVTHKTPFRVVFRGPIFNVPLLPTGGRLTAQVMDEDGSTFAGEEDCMVALRTEKSLDTVTSLSANSIQQWLDAVQQASPTTDLRSSHQLTETSTSCHTTSLAAQPQTTARLKGA
jgi:hypothetical protein